MSKSGSYKSYSNYSTSTHNKGLVNKNHNLPSFISSSSGFLQTVKEGFGLGIGSSIGQLMTYSVFGSPKVNVQHNYANDEGSQTRIIDDKNISTCNSISKNCSELLLNYEKCLEIMKILI